MPSAESSPAPVASSPPPVSMESGAPAGIASPAAPAVVVVAPRPVPPAVVATAAAVVAVPAPETTAAASRWVPAAPGSPAPVVPVAAAETAPPALAPIAATPETSAPVASAGETSKASSGKDPPPPQSDKQPTTMASTEPNQGAFPGMQFSSGKEPIHITGNSMSFDQNKRSVVWSGRVHVNNGNSQVTSDTLRVNYGQDLHDVKEMIADGNVRISQGTRWATGDHAILDQSRHTVTLTGSPVVHDGEDQIAGTKITVHLDTNQSDVENARAVIYPKQPKPSVDGGPPSRGASAAAQTPDRPPQVPPAIQGSPTEDNNP